MIHRDKDLTTPLKTRRMRWQRGTTLIEALIAALLSLLVGSAVLMLVQNTYTARNTLLGEGAAMRDTRQSLDVLANNLRTAQMVSGLGVFSAATTNSVTCYTNTAGTTTTRFWLDTSVTPAALKQTTASGTSVLLTDVQSLQFTYYADSSSNFTSTSGQWVTTASPNAPTAAEIPNIGAVGITVTVSSGGISRTLSTLVRLRNSPAKPHI